MKHFPWYFVPVLLLAFGSFFAAIVCSILAEGRNERDLPNRREHVAAHVLSYAGLALMLAAVLIAMFTPGASQ